MARGEIRMINWCRLLNNCVECSLTALCVVLLQRRRSLGLRAATSFPESLNECDGSKLFQITMSPLKRVDVYIFNNKACSRMVRFNMVVSEAVQELVYSS